MKKIILLSSVILTSASTSVFASQARLLALGMNEVDNDGVYYIQDSRNIFLNPAFVNNYADQLMIDWGSSGQLATASTSTTNQTATVNNNTSKPKAQGGVIKKYGDLVYGVYYGNESNTSSLLRVAATSAVSAMNGFNGTAGSGDSKMLQTSDNQIDVFVGGDNGTKWGANLLYASGKDETRSSKDSALAARVGFIGSNWDAHLNMSLVGKSESTDTVSNVFKTSSTVRQEFKGKLGLMVGGSYLLSSNNRLFGYVKKFNWDQVDSATYTAGHVNNLGGQNGTTKGDFLSYYFGWGADYDVNSGDKVFTSIAVKKTDINLEFANKSEVRHMVVPITIGYEAKATEWLTLRGSVIQNIFGTRDNKNIDNYSATGTRLNKVASGLITKIYGGSGKATISNSTSVNAGATLTFGNLAVDGLIGTTDSNGSQVVSATDTNAPKKGILSWRNLETSVGMTYKF